jgi:hypothetical protein
MPDLDRFYREAANKAAILGVVEGRQEGRTRAWVMSGRYTLPILIDQGNAVFSAYQVRSLPTLILIDPAGNIVKRIIGGAGFEELNELVEDLQGG